jgi:hypothetical protein
MAPFLLPFLPQVDRYGYPLTNSNTEDYAVNPLPHKDLRLLFMPFAPGTFGSPGESEIPSLFADG